MSGARGESQVAMSMAWPLSLAILGVAALCTAIVLVPAMAKRYAEEHRALFPPCPPSSPLAGDAPKVARFSAPSAASVPANAPDAAPKSSSTPAEASPPSGAPSPAGEPAVQPASSAPALPEDRGPWTVSLNPRSYGLMGDGKESIEKIAAALAKHPNATVLLTGVNRPDKSSKRARRAADLVKERLTAGHDVPERQIQTEFTQDASIEGLIVRAQLVAGEKP